jgi:hypothetical protein
MIGRRLAATVFLLLISACASPHAPISFKHVESTTPAGTTGHTYPPRTDKIWVTADDIPPGVKYEVIEQIDVGSHWYGSVDKLNALFAKRGRAIGADAIVHVRTWHQPSMMAWSAPQGQGIAIKLLDADKKFDLTKLAGGLY